MLKRILFLTLLIGILLFSSSCDWEDPPETPTQTEVSTVSSEASTEASFDDSLLEPNPGETWAIYWYLCGSDLESESGFATADLEEMMQVTLPDNVQVIIQTGGAWMWQNDVIDETCIERYIYHGDQLTLVEQLPQANMGESDTLRDFLYFCQENYPADRTMMLFWNHGGGSVTGAAFDENYDYDSLTLSEFYTAFYQACPLSEDDPPFDIIGFDTCLMGSIDTAYTFREIGRYLISSEEFEPAGGWDYHRFLQALANHPEMSTEEFAKIICDTYQRACRQEGVGNEITLSVVDLSRLSPLLDAYESMGAFAISQTLENPGFLARFARQAEMSENYGGNTWIQGYSNLVDLGDLARHCRKLVPYISEDIENALNDCVVYQVRGPYRSQASGLSCYYSYDSDEEDLYGYMNQGYGEAFKHLFYYSILGELSPQGQDYIDSLGYGTDPLEPLPGLEPMNQEEFPLYVDDYGYAVLELDTDTLNMLKGVYFELSYLDGDRLYILGQDNNIQADWETGVFRDNFLGTWGSIDGHLVYMEVYHEAEDYTAYTVPILLNGESYNLHVIYDYIKEGYFILGARKPLDEHGMADKNMIQLLPGDEITTIHYGWDITTEEEWTIPAETFTVSADTCFYDTDLGDGAYIMMFELLDASNNTAYSQLVQFTVDGDYIETEVLG